MENIIPVEKLPAFIDEAIAKVNEGVALARRRGILAELPKEVQFDVVLVSRWQDQSLKVVSSESSNGEEASSDTGESRTVTSGSRSGKETSDSKSQSDDSGESAGQNNTYTYSD